MVRRQCQIRGAESYVGEADPSQEFARSAEKNFNLVFLRCKILEIRRYLIRRKSKTFPKKFQSVLWRSQGRKISLAGPDQDVAQPSGQPTTPTIFAAGAKNCL
jgi:hypothetical protein